MTKLLLLASLGAGAPVYFGAGQTVTWAPVTTHVDGTPCVVAGYELAITIDNVNLNSPGAKPIAVIAYGPNAWTGLSIDILIKDLASGGYRLQARAKNGSGIWSSWSAPLDGTLDLQPPAVPQVLGVR